MSKPHLINLDPSWMSSLHPTLLLAIHKLQNSQGEIDLRDLLQQFSHALEDADRTFESRERVMRVLSDELTVQNAELEAYGKNLEGLIEDRTRELADALKKAESASRAKGDFLANMSHEIRTPLNGILGIASLLADTPLTQDQQNWIKILRNSGDALLGILNDILDISKVESGQMHLEIRPFSLHNCLEDLTNFMMFRAYDQGIELILDAPLDLPNHYAGDLGRIRQILLNLLSNAIKFTEKGYVRLLAKAEDLQNGTHRLSFCVEDSGIGIAKDKLEHVFSKFTQAEESTSRRFGGTGLGLAICKQFSELMGGNISAESRLNHGSKFTFTVILPKINEQNQTQYHPTEKTHFFSNQCCDENSVQTFFSGSHRKPKAIVVDNNNACIETLSRYLSSMNFEVDFTSLPQQALSKLLISASNNDPYDVIFIESNLEGQSGRQLAKTIRSHNTLNLLPIVLMAASKSGSLHDPVELISEGIQGLLLKPIPIFRLYFFLRKVMEQRNSCSRAELQLITPFNLDSLENTPSPEQCEEISSQLKDVCWNKFSVLVVDDMRDNLLLASSLLRKIGVCVDIAESGKLAVEKSKLNHYDLVLMDCHMPEMNGFETTKHIHEHDKLLQREPTTIVALTADTLESNQNKCFEVGMKDFFAKPINKVILLNILKKWIFQAPESLESEPLNVNSKLNIC